MRNCSLPWARSRASVACALPPRIRETLPTTSSRRSMPCPTLCDHVHLPVQSGSSDVLRHDAARIHPRLVPGAHCMDQGGKTTDQHDLGHHCRLSRRNAAGLRRDRSLLHEVQYDAVFAFKYSPRPNTPAISMPDSIPEEEKSQRLQVLLDQAA